MGKEQGIPFNPADFGTRTEMGGQPPKEPSLLRFLVMVVAAVGAIVIANGVASKAKRFVEGEIQAASLTDD